ncbi:hypothetical protein NPIL_36191 [Nephila pilipes]|uniref:Uncharacterized protein n=1 Tax=Nephila pilipes TaxID=299642 RepID=A0A8X6MWF4_NEPPI|nr:hypothetical protein NPIL_36191 [Nephila pilipes]
MNEICALNGVIGLKCASECVFGPFLWIDPFHGATTKPLPLCSDGFFSLRFPETVIPNKEEESMVLFIKEAFCNTRRVFKGCVRFRSDVFF